MYLKTLFLMFLALLLSVPATMASNDTRAIYVVTNKANANSIIGYSRQSDGSFKLLGEFETGGKGTGDLEVPALKKMKHIHY